MKKYIKAAVVAVIFVILAFAVPQALKGQTCGSEDECRKLIQEYEQKLTTIRTEKNSLAAEVEFANTQIYLTTLRVQETENKIAQTEHEIDNLGSRIEGLNTSLDHLSLILLSKIVEGYKKRDDVNFLNMVLDAQNASTLGNRLKYLKTSQENDSRIAFRVQQAKLNFEQQKSLREDKKVELDALKAVLDQQKAALDVAKVQKQKLLADTQNDENTYQRLLATAQAQLSGFRGFVQSSGASSTIGANAFGSGSDGAYYSQRDERWASNAIGYSSENILNVGCLLSSVAMVATKLGDNQTPASIAADTSRFYSDTAYMNLPWKGVGGRSYAGGVNVDAELAAGNYVIAGVGGCGYGGSHFVVLTKKDGDSYIMHDPIYGPDKKFSDYYSGICSAATFK